MMQAKQELCTAKKKRQKQKALRKNNKKPVPQTERVTLHNSKHRVPCCRKKSAVLQKERRDTQQ